MSVGSVLVDTGPLVALFDPSDRNHVRCRTELARLEKKKLITSLAVMTETTYLLAFSSAAQQAFLTFVAAGAIELPHFGKSEVARASALMAKYADLPMDFADATLVVLAERIGTMDVLTLDSDFAVYRIARKRFRLAPSPRGASR